MIKDMLQGKPIGHPMHPVLVHLPIGLWTISLFFDAFALATRISIFVDGSFHMILTGVVCAILAAVPGFADYSDGAVAHDPEPRGRHAVRD
jgi:uncharacterized membrane protein